MDGPITGGGGGEGSGDSTANQSAVNKANIRRAVD